MTAFSSQVDSGVGHLVFNKPPVNAFDSSEWAAIAARNSVPWVKRTDVHVLVISAEGAGLLCAGVDIKELGAHPETIVPVNKGNYDTFEANPPQPQAGDRGPARFRPRGWVSALRGLPTLLSRQSVPLSGFPKWIEALWEAERICSGCSRCKKCGICISRGTLLMPMRRGGWVL